MFTYASPAIEYLRTSALTALSGLASGGPVSNAAPAATSAADPTSPKGDPAGGAGMPHKSALRASGSKSALRSTCLLFAFV